MNVRAHHPKDLERLSDIIRREANAKQRDRYRAVLLALEGQTTKEIMTTLARSRRFVQRWVYVYRDNGIDAVGPKRQTGRPRKLTGSEEVQLRERILQGAKPEDDVCSLRGQDIRRIISNEFGVDYSLPAVYVLLHRLGLSCLEPRPRHNKNDPQKMVRWLEQAPLLSKKSANKGRAKR